MSITPNQIILGSALEVLKTFTDNSIDCCVTSPPYWGLRDYGVDDQLGLEKTPEEFISKLTEIFNEVNRVLKPEGTLWLNLGDSYAAGANYGKSTHNIDFNKRSGNSSGKRKQEANSHIKPRVKNLKPKDLVGIPWMAAFSLRSAGWYLRQDIIWSKPNPMPESVTDRCTKSHEYIFLMSKSKQYYYDHEAIKQPLAESSVSRLSQDIESQEGSERVPGKTNGKMKAVRAHGIVRDRKLDYNSKEKILRPHTSRGENTKESELEEPDSKANKRSVWTIPTMGYKEAHFATYPEKLITDCIKAGCPEDGIVLDPFMGAGTTAIVARKLNRNYIGIELNPEYKDIAEKRILNELGMFS